MFEASFHFTFSSKDKQMIAVSGHECYLKRKNIEDLSDSNTPSVAVAIAIQPITDEIATQLALSTKENLACTAHRARASNDKKSQQSPQQPEVSKTRSFQKFHKI